MKVTVEKVSNGYLLTTDEGEVFVATKLTDSSYSYRGDTVAVVLHQIFEAEKEVAA